MHVSSCTLSLYFCNAYSLLTSYTVFKRPLKVHFATALSFCFTSRSFRGVTGMERRYGGCLGFSIPQVTTSTPVAGLAYGFHPSWFNRVTRYLGRYGVDMAFWVASGIGAQQICWLRLNLESRFSQWITAAMVILTGTF